jgi:predicted DCC family thiol-disulfide oxidoreductase YuxK
MRYRLLAAQTPLGHALYTHYGLDPQDYETNILIEDGIAHFKMDGSLRMFRGLGAPWSAIMVLRVLPRGARDWLYELLARNRYRMFGRRDECLMPSPEHEDRFVT